MGRRRRGRTRTTILPINPAVEVPPSGAVYTFPTTSYTFPEFSGVVNVQDYGADPTGASDSTADILTAISSNLTDHTTAAKIIYFPNGTYKVSNRIYRGGSNNWRGDFWLQGESESGTTIKLADSASGYTSAASPKAVIFQTSYDLDGSHSEPWTSTGTGAEGFRNMVADLTIDLGSGNAGAIGIEAMAHNLGSIRRVTIDGGLSGYAGISYIRQWPGPCLFHRITVNGCQYGFIVALQQYGLTMEHLRLSGQTVAGISVDKNQLAIRGIESSNTVPVIDIIPGTGSPSAPTTLAGVSLVDAELTGGSGAVSAIRNRSAAGKVFVRNVHTTGYRAVVDEGSTPATGTDLTDDEYNTSPTETLFGASPGTSLDLTINDTPESPYPTLAAMTNAHDVAASLSNSTAAGDQSVNIQEAIDDCTTAGLYFPSNAGRYNLNGTNSITIRGNVRHIMFNGADFFLTGGGYSSKPVFIIDSSIGGDLVVEHARLDRAGQSVAGGMWSNRSTHDVTFKDIYMNGYATDGSGTLGDCYVDDIIASGFIMDRAQNVWARQFNAEHTSGFTKTASGDFWILGWKTEYESPSGSMTAGRTEIIGMFTYPDPDGNGFVATDVFTVTNAALSIANMLSYSFTADYDNFVVETQLGVTQSLPPSSLDARGSQGHWISLYRSKL